MLLDVLDGVAFAYIVGYGPSHHITVDYRAMSMVGMNIDPRGAAGMNLGCRVRTSDHDQMASVATPIKGIILGCNPQFGTEKIVRGMLRGCYL